MPDDVRLRFWSGYHEEAVWKNIIADLAATEKSRDNEAVVNASSPGHPFRLVDRLLHNRDAAGRERLVVPSSLVQDYLSDAHDDRHHFGPQRMMITLDGLHFRWKRKMVEDYCRHCARCGQMRTDNQKPIGRLRPIQAPEEPMYTLCMEFVTTLPNVSSVGTPWALPGHDEFDAIMPVTCKTSKRTLLLPGHTTYTAANWAEILCRHLMMADWPCPREIISDRDAKFLSAFWQGLWRGFGTKLLMATAYHPQADGQAERKNQAVELALRYHIAEHPEQPWTDCIPALQWNMNNAHSRTIDMSPHEFLYGFKLRAPVDCLAADLPRQQADIRFMREDLRREAQLTMDIVAAEAKRRYDQDHRWTEFSIGDQVWLKTGRAYKPLHKQGKMTPPRLGPYTVVKRVGDLAYTLDFPPNSRVHPTVSVQYLTRCRNPAHDPFTRVPPPPGPVRYEGAPDEWEVEKVVDKRMDRRRRVGEQTQYLVRWKGFTAKDDEWKAVGDLEHCRELVDEYEQGLR